MDKIPSSPAPKFEVPAGWRLLKVGEEKRIGDRILYKHEDAFNLASELTKFSDPVVMETSGLFYFRRSPLPSGEAGPQKEIGIGSLEGSPRLTPEEAEKLVRAHEVAAAQVERAGFDNGPDVGESVARLQESRARFIAHLTGGESMKEEIKGSVEATGAEAPTVPELLLCPFCGKKPLVELTKVKHCQLHGEPYQNTVIRCRNRCASFEGCSVELAAIEWNRRPAPPVYDGTPKGLDLEDIELDLKTHEATTRASTVFKRDCRDLLAEVRSLSASLEATRGALESAREGLEQIQSWSVPRKRMGAALEYINAIATNRLAATPKKGESPEAQNELQ